MKVLKINDYSEVIVVQLVFHRYIYTEGRCLDKRITETHRFVTVYTPALQSGVMILFLSTEFPRLFILVLRHCETRSI